jgi:hypothetical protein
LRYLRLFSIRQVYDAIARAAGLPEGSSSRIEDLGDLERYDIGMQSIAMRQQTLEESQDRARNAWRDHEERIRALEAQVGAAATLTTDQRGHVYQLVQQWAQARIDREGIASAAAFAGCWAAIKTRYRVAKYEHIPAAQYQDCVGYIERAYHALTGETPAIAEHTDE